MIMIGKSAFCIDECTRAASKGSERTKIDAPLPTRVPRPSAAPMYHWIRVNVSASGQGSKHPGTYHYCRRQERIATQEISILSPVIWENNATYAFRTRARELKEQVSVLRANPPD